MEHSIVEQLQDRLACLEAETRRWKWSAVLTLVAVVLVFLMGQAISKPKIIEAQRVIIRGWDGEVRMVIGDEMSNMKLSNPDLLYQETPSMLRSVSGWGIHIYDHNGRYSAGFLNQPLGGVGGVGTLLLKDTKTATGVWLEAGENYAAMHMYATDQTVKEKEEEVEERAKRLSAAKTPEQLEAAESVRRPPNHEATLRLSDKSGTNFVLSEKGRNRAVLGNVSLETKQGVVEQYPLSSLVLFDKTGRVLWSAPR